MKRRTLVDLGGRSPADFNRALHFVGDAEWAAKMLSGLDVPGCLPLLTKSERTRLGAAAHQIRSVLNALRFATRDVGVEA